MRILLRSRFRKAEQRLEKIEQIDPRFADSEMPLTRHMLMTWHKMGLRDSWQINSAAGRLRYIVRYIVDAPAQSLAISLNNRQVIKYLNAEANAFLPLTVFWVEVWRQHFIDRADCHIFREDGYYQFITEASRLLYDRRLSLALFPPSMQIRLSDLQVGFEFPPITRCFYNIWAASKQGGWDIKDAAIRDAVVFDLLLRLVAEQGRLLYLSADYQRYWCSQLSPGTPYLNRFSMTLAALSERYGKVFESGRVSAARLREVNNWLSNEVFPQMPGLAHLVPKLLPAEGQVVYDEATGTSFGKVAASPNGQDSHWALFDTARADEAIDVLVVGQGGTASGLGAGMRRSVAALKRTGVNFRTIECSFDTPVLKGNGEDSTPVYQGEKPKIVLWHFNAEYIPDVMVKMRELLQVGRQIGYFFWETEAMPVAHELGCKMLDEIWVPSAFCQRTYEGRGRPTINVGSSVELPQVGPYLTRKDLGLSLGAFIVMFSFDSHSIIHRKNPAAVVRAFKKAFPRGDEKAMLVIKTQNLSTAPWGKVAGRGEELLELCASDARVLFFDRTMSLRELYSLKKACDCYMSLHRSEGYGYGPAEAMALGRPVIMTGYSANTEFATDDNCILIDGPLIDVQEKEYLYWVPGMKWADPDVDRAAESLRRLYDNPEFAASLGKRAAETINVQNGPEAMAARYAKRLNELGIATS